MILTQDEDFLRFHASGIEHAGLGYASRAASIGDIIYGCMLVFEVLQLEDMINHVEYL